jgi:hypothetical protein
MFSSRLILALLTASAFSVMSPTVTSQDPKKDPEKVVEQQKLVDEIRKARDLRQQIVSDLLKSIEVNGKALPADSLQRATVFLAGNNLIELKILEFMVEEWKARLIKEEGKKEADFVVDPKIVEAEIKKNLNEFAIKYPGLDFWEVVRSQTGVSKDRYLHQRIVTMVFDKVFMPGSPDKWPAISVEAIKAGANGSDGEAFWDGLKKNSKGVDGEPKPMPAFWLDMIRKMLVTQLKKWSDIKFPADGLPGDVVLEVNGRRWLTSDAFAQVKEGLFVQDMETAVSELVCREALKQELTKANSYLSDKDFREQFAEYRKQFDSTLFNTEMIARAFKGYPTLEAFRSRWRLMKSYEDMIAKEINDDSLQAYAEKHKRFFADGNVNVDVIAFLGRDVRSGAWQPNGMAKALKRAEKSLAGIKGGTSSFDKTLEASGEYYTQDKERGRLGSKSYNELRRSLRESEYTDLLKGFSLGYFIFYEGAVGKVLGPIQGAEAWYLVRINGRTPAKKPVSVKEARTRDLVKQDYVAYRFLEWSKKVLETTKLK